MSERQAGYAPQVEDEKGVRVKVQVQAPSEELDDLVAVIVGRLEGAGLRVVQCPTPHALAPERENIELMFKRAAWLG
jgi:hypothetical protein